MILQQGSSIKMAKNKCLNELHSGASCYHCVQHCPGKSLMTYENQIYQDPGSCLGCGLCLADCPTGAFTSTLWDEKAISKDLKEMPEDTVRIFCGYHDKFGMSAEDKRKGLLVVPGCLSMVSRGGWYEMGSLKKLELRLDKCENCLMRDSLDRLKIAVETANEWLIACGSPERFSYINKQEGNLKEKKLKVDPSGIPVTSRRDFFVNLINRGRLSQPSMKSANDDSVQDQEKKYNCADWQLRLGELYSSQNNAEGHFAYWPDIKVESECVNCGMCAKYCPSKALRKVDGEDRSQRYFTSGYCLDCRICMLSCPKQCISRDRVPNANPFDTKLVFETNTCKCLRCGADTVENPEHLCYWCRSEAKEQDMITSVLNKLSIKRSDSN